MGARSLVNVSDVYAPFPYSCTPKCSARPATPSPCNIMKTILALLLVLVCVVTVCICHPSYEEMASQRNGFFSMVGLTEVCILTMFLGGIWA